MKKTLIISNLFWVLLFSAILFKNCTPQKPTQEKCEDLSKSYEKDPFVGFPSETAKVMSQLYVKKHYAAINRMMKIEDARAVWFSLDSLKKYIWHIEKASCETGSAKLADLGIRIYFAEYPDAETMKNLPGLEDADPRLAGKHSVFLVPTVRKEGADKDFDPIVEWKRQKDSGKKFLVQPDYSSSVMNHASLCPVACGTSDLSY